MGFVKSTASAFLLCFVGSAFLMAGFLVYQDVARGFHEFAVGLPWLRGDASSPVTFDPAEKPHAAVASDPGLLREGDRWFVAISGSPLPKPGDCPSPLQPARVAMLVAPYDSFLPAAYRGRTILESSLTIGTDYLLVQAHLAPVSGVIGPEQIDLPGAPALVRDLCR